MSVRSLRRLSLRQFGYGTATLARILRFQRFLAVASMTPRPESLAMFAALAGYVDHAHLARDCRAITSLSPTAFLAEYFPTFPNMADPYKTAERVLGDAGVMNETDTDTATTADRSAASPTASPPSSSPSPPTAGTAPSPCEGWTVADVVDHVATTEREFLERMELPTGAPADLAASGPDATVAAWRASSAAMQAVVDDPAIVGRTYDGYFGPTTIGETIDTFYASDLVVHAGTSPAAPA